jgi:hypothetical protein
MSTNTPEEDRKLLEERRTKFIETTRKARARAAELAEEANELNLGPLARSWDYVGKTLEADLALTLRMLQGNIPEGFQ